MNGIPSIEEFHRALSLRHGAQLQSKFENARVAICGLGGLGSNIAFSLARAGVGRLHLIDFDRVELTNLNRQQYFVRQLGEYKTDALRANLESIAPYVKITTDRVRITEDNAAELLRNDDIICEAFDSAECKAMLIDTVSDAYPEKYLVAGSGMAGISSANSIKTRKITARLYICGDNVSDVNDNTALLSSRVSVCAAHQAHTVLRIIAGEYDE